MIPSRNSVFFFLAFVTLAAFYQTGPHARAEEVTVTRWDNTVLNGTFRGFSANGRSVKMENDGSVRRIPIRKLLKIQFDQSGFSSNLPTRLELRGGGRLMGELMEGGNQNALRLSSPVLSSESDIRLTWIKRIAFTERTDRETDTRDGNDKDLLFDTGGDRYQGVLTGITPENIRFEDENLGQKTIPLEQVRELLLAPIGPPPSEPDGAFLEIYGPGGSVLPGAPLSFSDNQLVLSGLMEGSEWAVNMNSVRTILIRNGKVRYLSDMEPTDVIQKEVFPWQTDPSQGDELPKAFRWRRDKSVPDQPGESDPISLDGTVYEKGIGCTSYTKLTYELDGSYRRFRATIGLDDRADDPEHEGAAVFRVVVDGEERFSSAISSTDPPKSLDVDVSGASTMSLIVDLKTGFLDYANWAGAHLVRNE